MRSVLISIVLLSCLLGLSWAQDDVEETFEIKGRVLLNFRGNSTHPEGSPAAGSPQQQKEAFRQMRVVLKGSSETLRTAMIRQDGSFLLCVSHRKQRFSTFLLTLLSHFAPHTAAKLEVFVAFASTFSGLCHFYATFDFY
jgi:hypothetical protein